MLWLPAVGDRVYCPFVVEPLCRKPGPDDIDGVQRKHRNEQMAFDPFAQLVSDRAQFEFGLERLECGFQFSRSPVSLNRIRNAPLRVASAQDIVALAGIARIKCRIALSGHGAGLTIQGLRGGHCIIAVDHDVPFPQPPSRSRTLYSRLVLTPHSSPGSVEAAPFSF